MTSKTFKATIVRDGSICFIPLAFDSKAVFGKVRVPVKVTLNGYTHLFRASDQAERAVFTLVLLGLAAAVGYMRLSHRR